MRRTILTLAAGGRYLDPDRVYTVQRGDTLWDLAEEFLDSPWLWPLIWQANPELVEHPHWIYPGEELYIPPNVPPDLPARIQVRIRDDEPIVALTREQLLTLWRRLLEYGGTVVPDIDEYWELAHIVASAGEERTMLATHDEVYISGGDSDGFRTGVEPPVWESAEEALAERGYICWERDGRNYAAQGHVVYINWGTEQRLQPGSRVNIWREGRTVDDPASLEAVRLPDEKIGTLGVIKVTLSTATCLVLGSTTRLEIGDYVNYVRR